MNTGLTKERVAALGGARVVAVPELWNRFHVPLLNWSLARKLVGEADLVHLMGHWSVLNALIYIALRRVGTPYVVCPAGALPIFGRSRIWKYFYNFLIGNAIVRDASGCIAVTEAEISQFEAYGVKRDAVTVIPNGINAEDFPDGDSVDFRSRYGLTDDPIILFVGRFDSIKGADLLLDAFIGNRQHLPGCQLVFVGAHGGEIAQLRALVERNDLQKRVHFLGYLGGIDKSLAYRCANLLVVPSRQEAMSIVALEAGICGTPVLVTDQCGLPEVKDISPLLEVPADVGAIGDALVDLLRYKDLRERLGEAWRKYVISHYSWDVIVTKYLTLYSAILAPRSK